MSRTKRVAANLALALVGVAFAFIVAEIAVRVTGLAKVSLYTWDAYRGWGLKPGAAGWQRDEGEGFQVLSLAPPMQAYADAHHTFLAGFNTTKLGVGHWNADGHRVAGELIAQKICAMLTAGEHPEPAN